MAAIRVLPAVQSLYQSIAGMQSAYVSVERVLNILALETSEEVVKDRADIPVPVKTIELRDVWFKFPTTSGKTISSDWILRGVNVCLPANKRVALVGKTGGGKTTISDIFSGLHFPEKGHLYVDDEIISKENITSWRKQVACVPQSIFLIDLTIKENIAFGEDSNELNLHSVKEACKFAQIDEFIENRNNKYEEIVGENGIKLSGGQRQRIGLARAIYRNASILILDEATSALDNKTEKAVMETVKKIKNVTMLIIAHRLDTIKNADLIYEIEAGKVVASGTYEQLMLKSASFQELVESSQKN